MSQENVRRVRAVYAEWAKGNFQAGEKLFTSDTRLEMSTPDRRPVIGPEAIEVSMREFLAQWSEFRVVAEPFADFGEDILVTERQHGTGKGSGLGIEQTFYCVWRFRERHVVRIRWDTNRKRALEAAGLRE